MLKVHMPHHAAHKFMAVHPSLSEPNAQELGINVEHILLRMQGVAFFKKLDEAGGCMLA